MAVAVVRMADANARQEIVASCLAAARSEMGDIVQFLREVISILLP